MTRKLFVNSIHYFKSLRFLNSFILCFLNLSNSIFSKNYFHSSPSISPLYVPLSFLARSFACAQRVEAGYSAEIERLTAEHTEERAEQETQVTNLREEVTALGSELAPKHEELTVSFACELLAQQT